MHRQMASPQPRQPRCQPSCSRQGNVGVRWHNGRHERGDATDVHGRRGSAGGGSAGPRSPCLAGGLRTTLARRSRRTVVGRGPRIARARRLVRRRMPMSSSTSRSARSRPTRPRATSVRAAYLALDVARSYGYAGKPSIASAWSRRAERIIGRRRRDVRPRLPGPGPQRGRGRRRATSTGACPRRTRRRDRHPGRRRRPEGARADQPGLVEDRHRIDVRRVRADGRGLDRGRQRRAVPGDDRRDGLPDDRRLPRHDRLPARQRVDRGDREVLRPPVALRVPGHLPDPPSRGRRSSAAPGSGPSRNSSAPPPSWAPTTRRRRRPMGSMPSATSAG